jgi:hypothetical protein
MATSVVVPEIVNTASDMVDMAPADLFDGIDSSADGAESGTEEYIDDGSAEPSEQVEEIADPGAITSEIEEPEAEPEVEPAAVAANAVISDLPEGVTVGKNKAGKEGLFVEKSQWDNSIGAAHKLVAEISNTLGEPATLEALSDRIKGANALELLYSDVTSAEAGPQAAVINHLFDRMENAFKTGEIGTDPAISFAQNFYSTLKQRNPDAYATLRLTQARDFLGEMFEMAAERGDQALFNSTQHFVRALTQTDDGARLAEAARAYGLPYYEPSQMATLKQTAANDPLVRLQRENESLRQAMNGRSQNNQAESFSTWQAETTQGISKSVNEKAILPVTAQFKDVREKRPDDVRRLVDEPLYREVLAKLKTDPEFQSKLKVFDAQARRATSPQVRAQIRERMEQTYVNRATLIANDPKVKGPILQTAATALANGSASTHARRTAAQSHTAPRGAGTATPKSLVPNGAIKKFGDTYTSDSAMAEMLAMLGS